jgi:rhamnogalacturonyl hydrolase YesR
LGWSSAWLLRATNDSKYKTDFEKHWTEFKLDSRPQQFSWDDKTAGLQVLMAKVTGDQKYKKAAENYCDWVTKVAPKSPKGMI